jgi:hypothetical protein
MRKLPFVIDASNLHINDEDLSLLLFENNLVKVFLESDSNSCISSAKGFGKTFLLKVKRQKIQKNTSIHCIPQSQELDTIGDISISKNLLSILSDYHKWVALWKISISLSVIKAECKENREYNTAISNTFRTLDETSKKSSEINNKSLYGILEQGFCDTPCEILSYILSFGNKGLLKMIKRVPNVMAAFNRVNHAYAIFIDSIDEKLISCLYSEEESSTKSIRARTNIWYYAQYSLLEAIHNLSKTVSHIKIHCGIRQEVIQDHSRCPTDLHQQISNLVTKIDYSCKDLKEMFYKYVDCLDESYLICPEHKKNDKSMAFFGREFIENINVKENEDPFYYIYRHSLKRPRDIMDMCIAICERSDIRKDINEFRRTVNNKAVNILEYYLHNIEPFIVDEFNKDSIESFINKYIDTNIFVKEGLIEICSKYNTTACPRNKCDQCKEQHPFCTLYNIGLLGYIKSNKGINDINVMEQYFLPPGHSLYPVKATLPPESKLYFLHPAVYDWLKIKKNRSDINDSQQFAIGDSKSITQEQIDDVIDKIEKTGKSIVPTKQL